MYIAEQLQTTFDGALGGFRDALAFELSHKVTDEVDPTALCAPFEYKKKLISKVKFGKTRQPSRLSGKVDA